MDYRFLAIYYLVSLALSTVMIKGTADKGYKAIGVLFAITFLYFLISYLDLIPRIGLQFFTIPIAFVWYVVKRFKAGDFRPLDEIFLALLPFVTAFSVTFSLLRLNGWNDVVLFCILVLSMTVIYLLTYYVRKRSFREVKEAVELNGLFGVILIPMLI